jgi:hypothetical protein
MTSGFYLHIPLFCANNRRHRKGTQMGLQNRCTTTVLSRQSRSFPRFLRKSVNLEHAKGAKEF